MSKILSGLSMAVILDIMNQVISGMQARIEQLSEQGTEEAENELAEIEDLLLTYSKAEMELREAYEHELKETPSNLPNYEEIVEKAVRSLK